jgi:hypothetical protein
VGDTIVRGYYRTSSPRSRLLVYGESRQVPEMTARPPSQATLLHEADGDKSGRLELPEFEALLAAGPPRNPLHSRSPERPLSFCSCSTACGVLSVAGSVGRRRRRHGGGRVGGAAGG